MPYPEAPRGINFLVERTLLGASQLAQWQGLPLCWVEARPRVVAGVHWREHPTLALLDAGEAEADFAFPHRRQQIEVNAGTMGLFEAGETRSCQWRCTAARRIIVELDLRKLDIPGIEGEEWFSAPLRQDLAFHDVECAALLRAMAREVAAGCPNGRLYAESLSLSLAMRLVAGHARRPVAMRERGRLSAGQLARVNDAIEQGLAGPIALDLLAKTAGLSPAHFTRLMRNAVGCSPHRYVMRMRVERARELLERTRIPLATIAVMTGFASQSHMNAVVAASLGETPGRIRRGAGHG